MNCRRVSTGTPLSTTLLICTSFVVLSLVEPTAQASIIPIDSSLTFGGTNLPGACTSTTCSDTITFSATPTLIDGGAVSIYETQTPMGGGGEWDVWHLSTTAGGPLAGNVSGFWDLVMDYDLGEAVDFDAVVSQWTVNGTPVSPLSNFGGICCATPSNPSPLSGEAYYNSGFSAPLPAGVQSNWQEIYVSPYSFVSAGGINPDTANGFNFGLHFTPQAAATPEPASLALFATGLLGFGTVVLARKRQIV